MKPKINIRPVLLISFLVAYLTAGLYTELVFIQKKPLPEKLLSDFRLYQSAHKRLSEGGSLYDGVFLYPSPSLLIVGVFSRISDPSLQSAFYLTINILLMSILVYGIAHLYGLPFKRIWYWFPLVFGYAPLLESLHYGQINTITTFGIFLLFWGAQSYPLLSGLGLSLAIITKFSPFIFLGYLGVTRQYKALAWTLFFVGMFSMVAIMRYGWAPFQEYPSAIYQLVNNFPINANVHSFVSKLGTLDQTELMNPPVMEPLMNLLQPLQELVVEHPEATQKVLVFYFGLILAISAFISFKQKHRDEFFIITALCILFYPNLIWYHHYVFLIMPLLIWMASAKLDPRVVTWCMMGLFVIQVDRWHLTYGLLIHMFGHSVIWIILYSQIKSLFDDRSVRGRMVCE